MVEFARSPSKGLVGFASCSRLWIHEQGFLSFWASGFHVIFLGVQDARRVR